MYTVMNLWIRMPESVNQNPWIRESESMNPWNRIHESVNQNPWIRIHESMNQNPWICESESMNQNPWICESESMNPWIRIHKKTDFSMAMVFFFPRGSVQNRLMGPIVPTVVTRTVQYIYLLGFPSIAIGMHLVVLERCCRHSNDPPSPMSTTPPSTTKCN